MVRTTNGLIDVRLYHGPGLPVRIAFPHHTLFRRKILYNIYTSIIFFVVLLIAVDLEIYNPGDFVLMLLHFFSFDTKRSTCIVSHLPWFWIGLTILGHPYVLCYCFRFASKGIFFHHSHDYGSDGTVLVLVVMAALIIPIRGGFTIGTA